MVRKPVDGDGRTRVGPLTRVGARRGADIDGRVDCMRLLAEGVERLCNVGRRVDEDVVGRDVVALGREVVVVGRARELVVVRLVDVTGLRLLVGRTGRAWADELVVRRTGLTRFSEPERDVVALDVTRLAVV